MQTRMVTQHDAGNKCCHRSARTAFVDSRARSGREGAFPPECCPAGRCPAIQEQQRSSNRSSGNRATSTTTATQPRRSVNPGGRRRAASLTRRQAGPTCERSPAVPACGPLNTSHCCKNCPREHAQVLQPCQRGQWARHRSSELVGVQLTAIEAVHPRGQQWAWS